MTQIDPPSLDLDAGPSDTPIESVIPELADPFRIEGHLGQDADEPKSSITTPRTDVPFSWGPYSYAYSYSYSN